MQKIILLAVLLFPHLLHAQVTIESLLSVPFPTDLRSSSNGKHIAWVFNDNGVRNLFEADAPDFTVRKLTHHTSDDGIDISSVNFTPGGDKISFIEGNPKNGKGESANPALLQVKTDQTVWIVDVDGKNLKKIGSGDDASASINSMVAFISKGEVWAVSLDSAKDAQKLIQTRGNLSSIRWSPDGNRLVFISNRGSHSFVGIYDMVNKTVNYPDPSVDKDMNPPGRLMARRSLTYERLIIKRGCLLQSSAQAVHGLYDY